MCARVPLLPEAFFLLPWTSQLLASLCVWLIAELICFLKPGGASLGAVLCGGGAMWLVLGLQGPWRGSWVGPILPPE